MTVGTGTIAVEAEAGCDTAVTAEVAPVGWLGLVRSEPPSKSRSTSKSGTGVFIIPCRLQVPGPEGVSKMPGRICPGAGPEGAGTSGKMDEATESLCFVYAAAAGNCFHCEVCVLS